MQTWSAIVTQEIALTIFWWSIESGYTGTKTCNLCLWRACEANECFSITIGYQIWIVTLVCGCVECQTDWTRQFIATAISTVQKITAICLIAQFEIAELMWTIFGWLQYLLLLWLFTIFQNWKLVIKSSGFVGVEGKNYLSGLQTSTILTFHIDWILARECE